MTITIIFSNGKDVWKLKIGRAYFLTFSTYGSYLLGREKGSYRWNSFYVKPNQGLRRYMERRLNESSVMLSFKKRALIHDAFMASACLFGWEIDALNVRTRHVHIVLFTSNGESGEEIVRKLKTGATYALQKNGFRVVGSRVWTKSFAITTIWNIGFWRRKVVYTLDEQGSNLYLRSSQFGKMWIERIRTAPIKKKYTMQDLYGGRKRAAIRAAFFRRLAEGR